MLIIILFGAIKTSSLKSPESDTVKIAAIVLLPEGEEGVIAAENFLARILTHMKKQ